MYLFPNKFSLIKVSLLLFSVFLLISCDPSEHDALPVVNSQDRLSDAQLQQLQQQQQQQQQQVYYFGFDLRASPQEDASQYLPFLKYLETTTGYQFKLHFTSNSSSTVQDLGMGKIQFAAMWAMGLLRAQSQYEALSLVRGLNFQGKKEYQSVFVVRPNSHIHNINDIKGKSLVFGDHDSTQGHLIPRIMLAKNNISLDDLKTYAYTESHFECAETVVSGASDVCGMQDQLAKKLVLEGKLRIIHTSDYYPSSGIVTHQSVPDNVIKKVKKALLNFDPKGEQSKELYHWEQTEMPKGFGASMDNDYDSLRQWSMKLGFLQAENSHEHSQ